MDLEALILVGGKGTRLQKVISDRPKALAPVSGRPFLEWLLISLKIKGFHRITLATGHLGDMVENFFKDGSQLGLKLSYSKEPVSLGTGGAVRFALNQINSNPLLVLNGDSFCPWDLNLMTQTHFNKKATVTMWLTYAQNCGQFGSVDLGEDKQILAFAEKKAESHPGLISAGIYLMQRECLNEIPSDRFTSLETDLFPRLIGKGLFGIVGQGPFLDIGTPDSYQTASETLHSKLGALGI